MRIGCCLVGVLVISCGFIVMFVVWWYFVLLSLLGFGCFACVLGWVWVVGAWVLDFGVGARLVCGFCCVLVGCFRCIVFLAWWYFRLGWVGCYSVIWFFWLGWV